MAQRRMFSKQVTNSSEFLMMSQSAQNLYFHFGMNADDDGFCEVFTIMRMTESKPDDLQALHNRGLVYVVDNKVCVVKDWHENNQIRLDRYKQSVYLSDPKYADIYKIIMEEKIKKIDVYKNLLNGEPNGNQMAPQVRLGKVRLEESIEEETTHTRFKKPTLEEVKAYNKERDNCIDAANFIDHYEANGWKVGGRSAMKDWKASIRTWEKTDKKTIAKRQDDIKYGKKEEIKPERILTPEEIEAKKLKIQEMKNNLINKYGKN